MRRIVLFLLIVASITFASCLKGVNFGENDVSVWVVINLDSQREVQQEKGFSGTVHVLKIKGCGGDSGYTSIPVRTGPLEFVSFHSQDRDLIVSFHTIIPVNPISTVRGNRINVLFMKSRRRYDFAFTPDMTLGDTIKFLAEIIGVNVSISKDIISTKLPSMKLSNVTPEDALRTVFMSLGVSYTYFPDGTMYVGPNEEDIRKKFLQFWGVEKEEDLIREAKGGILGKLERKTTLFMVGGREAEDFITAIEGEPKRKGYAVVLVDDKNAVQTVLEKIIGKDVEVITTLPGSAVVLVGSDEVLSRARRVLHNLNLIAREKPKTIVTQAVEVRDVESAKTVISTLVPDVTLISLPDERILLSGEKEAVSTALSALKIAGLLGRKRVIKAEEIYDIVRVKNVEDTVDALKVVFGDELSVKALGENVLLKGRREVVEEAKKFIEKLSKVSEKITTEIVKVPDPDAASQFLSSLFPNLKVIPGKGEIVLSGKVEDIEKAKEILGKLKLGEEEERIEMISVENPDLVSKAISEVFENVKVIRFDDRLILKGKEEDLKAVLDFIKELSGSWKGEKEAMKIVDMPNVTDEQLSALSGVLKDVKIVRVPGTERILVIGISEEAVEKAIKTMKEALKGLEREKPLVRDGKVFISVEGEELGKVVRKVLEGFGKSVVLVDEIATPVNMTLSGVGLEEFERIVERFGVTLREENGVVYVERKKVEKKEEIVEKPEEKEEEKPVEKPTETVLPPEEKKPEKEKLVVELEGDLLNVKSDGAILKDVISKVAEKKGISVVFVETPSVPVTFDLKGVTFGDFLRTVESFGYVLEEKDGVYYVERKKPEVMEIEPTPTTLMDIRMEDGKVVVNVENLSLMKLVKDVSKLLGKSIVFVDVPQESVTLNVKDMKFEDLEKLLEKFGYGLEEIDGVYYLVKKGKSVVSKISYGYEKLKSLVSQVGGEIFYDDTTGVVMVRNLNVGAYDLVKNYISQLKETPPQVAIEVKIIEESSAEDMSNSTQFGMSSDMGNLSFVQSGGAFVGNLNLSLSVLSSVNYESYLKGLLGGDVTFSKTSSMSRSKAKILASPSITAMSGEKAKIEIGGDRTLIITGAGTESVMTMKFPKGVTLEITPYVRPDGKIDMFINVRVEEVTGNYPEFETNRRSANTRVAVNSGDTIVIGGLTREEEVKSVEKIPILGDLPIIGALFRSETTRKEVKNLTIFITAKVVKK